MKILARVDLLLLVNPALIPPIAAQSRPSDTVPANSTVSGQVTAQGRAHRWSCPCFCRLPASVLRGRVAGPGPMLRVAINSWAWPRAPIRSVH